VNRTAYLSAWSMLHGGLPARGVIALWLGVQYACARPLAGWGVSPSALTLSGLLPAGGILLIGILAGAPTAATDWGWAICLLVLASALLDGLDGAVAILRDRVTTAGARLDARVDRAVEAGWAIGLILLGAPAALLLPALLLTYAVEALRPAGGEGGPPVLTVWERPTRVLVSAMFPLAATVLGQEGWLVAGGAGWAVLSLIGTVQVLHARRRRGRRAPRG